MTMLDTFVPATEEQLLGMESTALKTYMTSLASALGTLGATAAHLTELDSTEFAGGGSEVSTEKASASNQLALTIYEAKVRFTEPMRILSRVLQTRFGVPEFPAGPLNPFEYTFITGAVMNIENFLPKIPS
jgi:hypothetical protein